MRPSDRFDTSTEHHSIRTWLYQYFLNLVQDSRDGFVTHEVNWVYARLEWDLSSIVIVDMYIIREHTNKAHFEVELVNKSVAYAFPSKAWISSRVVIEWLDS